MQIEEKRCLPLFLLKNWQPYIQCCEALYESIFKTFMWKRISLKIQRDRDQPRPSSSNGLEMAASWSKGVKTSLQMSSKLCGQLDIVYIHVSKLFQNFVWMPCGFVLVQCILKRFTWFIWSNFWSYTVYQPYLKNANWGGKSMVLTGSLQSYLSFLYCIKMKVDLKI